MIEYRAAARLGDSLAASLYLIAIDSGSPVLGGNVLRLPAGGGKPETLARARMGWQRVERTSGRPAALPESLLASLAGDLGAQPAAARPLREMPGVARYQWRHRVMRAELAAHGRAQPQAVYHWLEEAIFNASADAGWPVERWLAEGYFTLNIRHDTSIIELPRLWEEVETTSQIVDLHRLRGTWLVELRRAADGALLVRDYSTGVFLNLDGRPASPPMQLLREIQFGRSTAN
jgi:acyl-CoA thioesterase FadM